jgi:hypothetical protein
MRNKATMPKNMFSKENIAWMIPLVEDADPHHRRPYAAREVDNSKVHPQRPHGYKPCCKRATTNYQ